jgi:hypothetical protein
VIVGILSDSHGRAARTRLALATLRAAGAQQFVHCGDICGEDVLSEFVGLPIRFVWGNNDEYSRAPIRFAQSLGLALPGELPLHFELDGKRFAVCHGHEMEFYETLEKLDGGRAEDSRGRPIDYVLHGHTHVPDARAQSGVRIINPGALHRASVFTVATLNLPSGELRFWRVEDGAQPNLPIPFEIVPSKRRR